MKRALGTAATIFALVAGSAFGATTIGFRELAHQHRGPGSDDPRWHALVSDRAELRRAWTRFNMEGRPPWVDFNRRIGVLAGTGGSSSCPLYVHDVRLRRAEDKVVVRVANDVGDSNACTDDFRYSTFLLSIRRDLLPPVDDLRARVRHVYPD